MVYAAVLAGGSGTRMGGGIPKQFAEISGRPVIARSVDAFFESGLVDRIFVAVPEKYFDYTVKLMRGSFDNFIPEIVVGGKNRNETLYNVLKAIGTVGDNDIILTHDAVRPFIDKRIIEENISSAAIYGACNTVVPATDTVLRSGDGRFINSIPPRAEMYSGQTPQTFNAKKLFSYYEKMSESDMARFTDACSVFVENGEKVFLVSGSSDNIKLTYPGDMERAEIIFKSREALK